MTDEEIILQFDRRSEDAISALDGKYGDSARRLAARIAGSREDGEECVNDGEIAVWNAIPPERPRSLAAYFYTIVLRLVFSRYRTLTAEKRGGRNSVSAELDECMASEGDAATESEKKALSGAIDRFLGGDWNGMAGLCLSEDIGMETGLGRSPRCSA